MATKFSLNIEERTVLGKGVKSLRVKGLIPAELYGHGVNNVHLAVPVKEFIKVYDEAGESSVINLLVGGREYPVLIHEAVYDHLNDEYKSIDFYQVNMDEEVTTNVSLVFVNEAPAVREGGVLVTVLDEIEVTALPANLPHEIQVDLSGLLTVGSSVHVKDLSIPDNIKVEEDMDSVIVTISEQNKEEEVSQTVDVSAVVVEGEEKKQEKEEEKQVEEKKE